ncbi:hypothetical protein GQ607_006753 [Colletotrichum asianum]|uniref:Uncharacterized protein n=1 Tax=Colletotrichum asianum TaxID=702518 RepID=A0A8H3WGJ5_9PEZI|nr:hypothetical protein GQ607_006753 [Colletotrichum asianum]
MTTDTQQTQQQRDSNDHLPSVDHPPSRRFMSMSNEPLRKQTNNTDRSARPASSIRIGDHLSSPLRAYGYLTITYSCRRHRRLPPPQLPPVVLIIIFIVPLLPVALQGPSPGTQTPPSAVCPLPLLGWLA